MSREVRRRPRKADAKRGNTGGKGAPIPYRMRLFIVRNGSVRFRPPPPFEKDQISLWSFFSPLTFGSARGRAVLCVRKGREMPEQNAFVASV